MNIKQHLHLITKGDKIGTPGFVRGLHDMHEKKVKWMRKNLKLCHSIS